MIRQQFKIKEYDWKVSIFYYVDKFYKQEILDLLQSMGCSQNNFKDARDNLEEGKLNSGLCYSNNEERKSVIVIARTSSTEEFANSCFHEAKHLLSHIEQEYNINPYSEEAAYLSGHIGQLMFRVAKLFVCDCHKKRLKDACS